MEQVTSERSASETRGTLASSASVPAKRNEKPPVPFAKRAKAFWCKFWRYFKWVLLVIAIFAVLAGVSLYNDSRSKRLSTYHLERIRSLLQYATKSADEAERVASDDALQALLHADYAVTYFSAAKHLVDKQTIEALIGTDLGEMEAYLRSLQQRLLARVYAQCE